VGKDYHAHVLAALELLEGASASLRRPDRSVVRVSTIPAFATRWLIPRLAHFHSKHPGIEVDVRTSIAFENLETKNIDYAIRLAPVDQHLSPPLCSIRVMPVWSKRHLGTLSDPDALTRHTLLSPDHRPEFWREWLAAHDIRRSSVTIRDVDSLLLYELACRGLGIAIGIEPLVNEMMDQKLLAGMTDLRVPSQRGFFLIAHQRRPSRAGQIFRRWLLREARTS
jgi:LysR family glycine cleavage system transcriptional activator